MKYLCLALAVMGMVTACERHHSHALVDLELWQSAILYDNDIKQFRSFRCVKCGWHYDGKLMPLEKQALIGRVINKRSKQELQDAAEIERRGNPYR